MHIIRTLFILKYFKNIEYAKQYNQAFDLFGVGVGVGEGRERSNRATLNKSKNVSKLTNINCHFVALFSN